VALSIGGIRKPYLSARSPGGSWVLRIKSDEKFPVLGLATPTRSRSCDFVLAAAAVSASPYGDAGIVSALARTQIGINDYGFFIRPTPRSTLAFGWRAGRSFLRLVRHQLGALFALGGQHGGRLSHSVNMVKSVIVRRGVAARRSTPWLGANLQLSPRASRNRSVWIVPTGSLVFSLTAGSPLRRLPAARRRHHGDRRTTVDDAPRGSASCSGSALGGSPRWPCCRGQEPGSRRLSHRGAGDAPPRHIPSRALAFQGGRVMTLSPAVVEELYLQTTAGVIDGVHVRTSRGFDRGQSWAFRRTTSSSS